MPFKQNGFKSSFCSFSCGDYITASAAVFLKLVPQAKQGMLQFITPLWILSQKASLSFRSPTEMASFPKGVSPRMCLPSKSNLASLLLSVPGDFFTCSSRVFFLVFCFKQVKAEVPPSEAPPSNVPIEKSWGLLGDGEEIRTKELQVFKFWKEKSYS